MKKSIDEYIASFPKNVQTVLEQTRQAIKEVAPKTEEAINYNMLTFKLNGNLVWFGAFKNPQDEFNEVRFGFFFELDKPMPLDLIKEMVRFRLQENLKETKE